MEFNDEEEIIKTKSKMYTITILSVIGVIILFITIFVFSVKSFFNDASNHKYYVLDVNTENKDKIISLLKEENIKYCESIYKIEYEQLFPNDKSAKIYCRNEKDVEFTISDNKESQLANYIYNNGILERK
ncbi:MAG: hypothetical protein J6B64_04930 [Bacilli bacterium]|nr:hypothetical protein [Bacilli bacterium]MBP3461949.1 hypothetical protein [Bacilli bacterium]MBP3921224.1 hypothetical protein [Bacilli bacterium]MBQ8892336.1 hypothetical protein [Bacilli bacterium]